MPDGLVRACARVGLALVALRREVRFATVAQSVGERIVDDQLTRLREAQHVHEVFTDLSVAEADSQAILDAVASLAGSAVVLESGQNRVVDYRAGPRDVDAFLEQWERRSRAVQPTRHTQWDESSGWLVTNLGRPERGWGRLVVESSDCATERLVAVTERGAAALALTGSTTGSTTVRSVACITSSSSACSAAPTVASCAAGASSRASRSSAAAWSVSPCAHPPRPPTTRWSPRLCTPQSSPRRPPWSP